MICLNAEFVGRHLKVETSSVYGTQRVHWKAGYVRFVLLEAGWIGQRKRLALSLSAVLSAGMRTGIAGNLLIFLNFEERGSMLK